ncbi:MAG: protein jag [Bacillaceae bacterium]|nr:protein jag [Bacillaceae bacterium]
MKKVTVTGKTVDEAVDKALKELETSRDKVEVRVLEEPSRGILGLIGAKDAKVEVELSIDPVAEARTFLLDVLDKMISNPEVNVEETEGYILFEILGDDLGLVIGKRGQTLDSLQYLVNLVANKHSDRYVKIVLDTENYREKRKKTLENLADRLADKVVRTQKSVRLEPMSALERKIIHTRLQNRTDVVTFSKGEEPNRFVVIDLKR